MKMKLILLLSGCILAFVTPATAQFNLPFDGNDCSAARLLDPMLVQASKIKFPKKYNSVLGSHKKLGLDAKYRAGAGKLIAKHMKSLNAVNQELQNMYQQQQQPLMTQPMITPDQSSSLLAQQQQQQLSNFQIPYDAFRSLGFSPSVDNQMPLLSQFVDQRLQQPTFQLNGASRLSSIRPQQTMFQTGFPLQL